MPFNVFEGESTRLAIKGLIACLLLFSLPSWSQILHQAQLAPSQIDDHSEWVIRGHNRSDQPLTLIIRLSQHAGDAYHQRINSERTLLPGTFELRIHPATLKTPRNKRLDLSQPLQLRIFTSTQQELVSRFRLRMLSVRPWTQIGMALDFGPDKSDLFPGFQRVTEQSSYITKGKIKAFSHPAPDALLRDGIGGIEQLRIPLPNGYWKLHLWRENVGSWQTLKPALERRLRVNGRQIDLQRWDIWQWIEQRYLRGRRSTQGDSKDAWTLIGKERGDLISTTVTITDGILKIDMAGSSAAATTLSALLVEPISSLSVLDELQEYRQQWFNQRWPLMSVPYTAKQLPAEITLLPGISEFVDISVEQPITLREFETALRSDSGISLTARIRLPQLQRQTPNSSLLQLRQELITAVPPAGARSRHFQLQLVWHGQPLTGPTQLQVSVGPQPMVAQLNTLSVRLPALQKPIGIYLDDPPHMALYYALQQETAQQRLCDLRWLRTLGLTGVAPALTTPDRPQRIKQLTEELNSLEKLGYRAPVLAYAPFKRLVQSTGQQTAAEHLRSLAILLDESGTLAPAWSIADEPSNMGGGNLIASYARLSQNATPNAKRAAHLNAKRDKRHLEHLDIALVNPGFGVDLSDIERIRLSGVSPWFYNMPQSRLAAGFYLWRLDVEGYLQWHGRMPTADPFDPTDGREDDQQLIPVMAGVCQPVPDMHQRLVDLIQGVQDLRWLGWLDARASTDPQARQLRRKLWQQLPTTWHQASQIKAAQLDLWRNQIIDLARILQ